MLRPLKLLTVLLATFAMAVGPQFAGLPAASAVDPDPTTTTLTITPTGQAYAGQLVTFDITVVSTSGAPPTGFIGLQTGGSCGTPGSALAVGELTAAHNGQLQFTHTFAAPFGYQFNACFFPEGSPFAASESGYQNYPILADATTTTLTISPTGSQYAGGLVTFDITVASTSGRLPTGFVGLQTGGSCGTPGSALKASTLTAADNGQLQFTHTFQQPFAYQFNACYFPDTGFGASESGYQNYPIVADATTTTLTITPTGSQYAGGLVTFDVTVASTSGRLPTGFVGLQTGGSCGTPGSALKAAELTTADNGQLQFTHTFDQPYPYIFNACYFPEGSPFGASESGYQSYPIVADATTTTLTITPAGSQYAGGLVTFDITVTSTSGAPPTGFVAIQSGGSCGTGSPTVFASLTAADNGQKTLTHTFNQPYPYIFNACYFPEGSPFGASESGYQDYPIVADATTTTLTITPTGQQHVGGLVTFDVTVTTTSGDAPTGHVAIQTGGPCGTGSPLELTTLTEADDGQKTFTHTFAEPFAYQFQACFFSGDGTTFGDSGSGYQNYPIIAKVPPAITLQPTDVTAYPGDTVSFTAAASGLPAPTVQWQVLTPGGSWTDIAGATSTTLTFAPSAGQSGNSYRAVFSNGAAPDAISGSALLTLRYGFLGFSSPIPKSKWAPGRTVPVKFSVVDRSNSPVPSAGTQLRVQLWSSPTGGVLATAGCVSESAQYSCSLRLPSTLTRGATYYIAAQISVSGGPWALLDPVSGARTGNPLPIRIR